MIPEADHRVRALLDSGRVGAAAAAFDAALADIDTANGGRSDTAVVLVNRALLAWRLGRMPLALELAAQGWAMLDVEELTGPSAAEILSMLGYLLEAHRRPAVDLLTAGVAVARTTGNRKLLAGCLLREGSVLVNLGFAAEKPERGPLMTAVKRLAEAEALTPTGVVHCRARAGRAGALAALGRIDEAEQAARDALAECDEEELLTRSVAYWALAGVYFRRGNLAVAKDFAAQAVADAERIHDSLLLMRFAQDQAEICAADGDLAGQVAAQNRTITAGSAALAVLREGFAQALEQRKLALRAQQAASIAQEAAIRDPLTGLLNRRGLELRAPILLERAAHRGLVPWLVLIDVDAFKAVNDDAGHAAGDLALHEIAQLLRAESRKDDLLCRWAGDEFILLLLDHGDSSGDIAHGDGERPAPEHSHRGGPAVAERIRRAVDRHEWPTSTGDPFQAPTVSIGVAGGPTRLDQLFRRADSALYRAKRGGRNRVEVIGLSTDDSTPRDPPPSAPTEPSSAATSAGLGSAPSATDPSRDGHSGRSAAAGTTPSPADTAPAEPAADDD